MTSAAQTSRALRRALLSCALIAITAIGLAGAPTASAASAATLSLTASASGVSPAAAITVAAGTSVTFTAKASATTGVVKFTVGTASPVAETIDASTSEATYTTTVSSTSTVTARYYATPTSPIPSGTSNSVTVTIGSAPTLNQTSISLDAEPTLVQQGQPATLTATLTGGVGTDGENVSFFDGGTLLGTSKLSGGVATLSIAGFANGTTHSFTANYPGDSQNMSATSQPVTVTVQIAPTAVQTTVTMSANPDPVPAGGSTTLTAHVVQTGKQTSPPAGEQVTFWSNGNSIGSANLDSNGNATLTVGGWASGNYSLTATYVGDTSNQTGTSQPLAVTFTAAAPPTLTITAPSTTVAYGSGAGTLSPSYAGFTGSDTVASLQQPATCSTTETAASPPGTYPVTCTGARSANYTIAYVAGTVTVTPATLTVTAPSASVPYGSGPGSLTPSYSGFVGSDGPSSLTAQATCSTTANAASAVGSYAVTCSGAASPNYTFTYVNGTITVTQAALTVTAPSTSIPYGSGPGALTPTYSGFVGSDGPSSLTTQASCTTTATASSPVGSYPVTCSGAASPNYTFTYVNGTVTVTQDAVTVTAPTATAVYGAGPGTLTPSYSGFLGSDGPSSLTTQATCTTTATASSPVGTYAVTCSGAASPNYTFTYVDGSLTVTKAPVTVTGPTATSVYGAAPGALTPTYSGFVGADGPSSLTTPATCATTATAISPVGSYPVTCSGASSSDYTFTYVDGTLAVTKAPLTVTGPTATAVYGAGPGTLTPSYGGFVNGDTAASLTSPATCTTTATAASPVGSYAVTCSGAASTNYSFTYANGSLAVTKAPLTVTGPTATSVYGTAPGAFAPSYSGFVNGDTAASLTTQPTCTTAATATSAPGSYAIACSGGASSNYAFTYVDGTLAVGKATLTVTPADATMKQGGTVPALTATLTGFVNGQTLATSDVTGSAACTTTATSASPVGTYPITCTVGTLSSADYSFAVSGTGTLTVQPAIGSTPTHLIDWTIGVFEVGRPVVLRATLLSGFRPLANETLTLTLGDQSCTAETNFLGTASCTVTPTGPAGTTTAGAAFAGDETYAPSQTSHPVVLFEARPRPEPRPRPRPRDRH